MDWISRLAMAVIAVLCLVPAALWTALVYYVVTGVDPLPGPGRWAGACALLVVTVFLQWTVFIAAANASERRMGNLK